MATNENLRNLALKSRALVVKMLASGNSPHMGSCLSIVDILTSIYFDTFESEITPQSFGTAGCPRVIVSKGHAAAAVYATLHLKGFLGGEELAKFNQDSGLPGHVDTSTKGVDFSTGSLGHGLAVGAGMALARKMDSNRSPVIVILGDGECEEGAVWEAANFAASNKLKNLVAIVDSNKWQAYGRVSVLGANLVKKWAGFGWNVLSADGHDFGSLRDAITAASSGEIPAVIIADTVKGKGVPAMEGRLESHYKPPKGNEFEVV